MTHEARFRLFRLAALAASIFGIVWLGMALFFRPPDLARAAQQAAKLQAIIRQKPQFSEVQVTALTNGGLSIFAPDELSPGAKTELERLVVLHAPDHAAPISYLSHIPQPPNPR